MDTHLKIPNWLKEMGYDGKIPQNMKVLCNTNTAHIWEQLINNVKPKQHIIRARNHLILQRLAKENVEKELFDFRNFHVKELDVWREKKRLMKKVNDTKERICKLENELENVCENNKIKYVMLENAKKENTLRDRRTFLLNAKNANLNREIFDVKEMLNKAKSLTPVEGSVEHNKTEVLDTLNKCAAKLQNIISKQSVNYNLNQSLLLSETKERVCNLLKFDGDDGTLDESLGILPECNQFDVTHHTDRNLNCDWAILNDDTLNDMISAILHEHNRSSLWNILDEMYQQGKDQLFNLIVDFNNLSNQKTQKYNPSLMKLYGTHGENELKIIHNTLNYRKLKIEQQRLRTNALDALKSSLSEKQMKIVESTLSEQLKDAAFDKGIEIVRREIVELRNNIAAVTNLQSIEEKQKMTDTDISGKFASIDYTIGEFKKVFNSVNQIRADSTLLMRKLSRFSVDLKWTCPLLNETYTNEINIFMEFPLESNGRLSQRRNTLCSAVAGSKSLWGRTDHIYLNNLNSTWASAISTVVSTPYNPSEIILSNMFKTKCRLEYKRSLQLQSPPTHFTKFSMKECENREASAGEYLKETRNYLSSATDDIVVKGNNLKGLLNLWLDMPFKEFIPNEKTFEGKSFSYYEQLYEDFYKQL